jgi:hypothetical protein
MANRNLAEIAVRRRYEASPVGTAMRILTEGMVADLVADLSLATGATRGPAQVRLRLISEIIVGASWTAIEALLGGTSDLATCAAVLAQLGAIVAAST